MGRRLRPRLCWQLAHVRAQCLRSQFTAQCLRSQDAHAALGRRGFLRAANSQARAWVGWRQVKVLPAFSKAAGFGGRYVPVGRCPAADRAGRRDQTPRPYRGAGGPGARWAPFRTDRGGSRDQPPPSHTQKKGGRMSPYCFALESGVLLVERASRVPPCPLPGLSTAERTGRVPPRPLQRLPPSAYAPLALHFFVGCAG